MLNGKDAVVKNNTEESEMWNKYFSSGTVKKPDVVISFEDRDEMLHLKQQRQHVPSTSYLGCVFYLKMHVGMLGKEKSLISFVRPFFIIICNKS